MKRILSIIIVVLMAGLFACSGGSKSNTVPTQTQAPKIVKKAEKVKPVLLAEEKQRPRYEVYGNRDPFVPFEISLPGELAGNEAGQTILDPLQKLTLSQIEVVGIIMGKQRHALIEDSSGIGYIVTEGRRMGENSGIITEISFDGVTIKQHFKDYMGRVNTREVLLSLRKKEGEI